MVPRSGLRSGASLQLFTIEYIARLISTDNANRYARSIFGIVDLLAVAPIYLSLLFGVTHSFAIVRLLRLLRVFRILKLSQCNTSAWRRTCDCPPCKK